MSKEDAQPSDADIKALLAAEPSWKTLRASAPVMSAVAGKVGSSSIEKKPPLWSEGQPQKFPSSATEEITLCDPETGEERTITVVTV